MKLIILFFCILSLKSSVLANNKYLPECKKDDCFCKERIVVNRIAHAVGQLEFLRNQKNFDQVKFRNECDKIDDQLQNKWGNLAKLTACQQIKTFIKKQLVLWEFFCTLDKELRQEFDGEYFGLIEECDNVIYKLCVKEGLDYCETDAHDQLLRCVEEDMKGKCANHQLFAKAVKKNLKFLKDNNRCGENHPGALNHHKKPPSRNYLPIF